MKSVVALVTAVLAGGLMVTPADGAPTPAPTTAPTPNPHPTILAPPQQGPAPQAPEVAVRTSRITGRDRTALSVGVARTVYPRGARVAYLASSTAPTDALLAGQLSDGPVLLVSAGGAGAATVRAEVTRLRARSVIAIGTTTAVSAKTLAAAAPHGVATSRIAGPDASRTARLVAGRAFPKKADTAYVVGERGLADAAVVGQLNDGPILLATSPANPTVGLLRAGRPDVVAVGGTTAVPERVLASARAMGASTSRLSGSTPAGTALAVARRAFPTGTATAYLVPAGDLFAAAISGGLTGGVVLVAPRCGSLPPALSSALSTWRPDRIVALGSASFAVCPTTLSKAAAAARS